MNKINYAKSEILTSKQLAKRLGVSERTIFNWRKMGLIPYIKLRSLVRFDYARVVAALNQKGGLV